MAGPCGVSRACGIWGAKPRRQRTSSARDGKSPWVAQVAQRLGVPWRKPPGPGVGQAPLSLTGQRDGGEVDVPVGAPGRGMTEAPDPVSNFADPGGAGPQAHQYRYFRAKPKPKPQPCWV